MPPFGSSRQGIINYLLTNDLWFKDFALAYTNLSTIIDSRFKDTSECDGLFSSWNEESKSYLSGTWQYEGMMMPSALAEHYLDTAESFGKQTKLLHERPPSRDGTLQHPNCVYQILKQHYAAYTPEKVEAVPRCPRDAFIKVAEALARNSGRERTGAICYAGGVEPSHRRRTDDPRRCDHAIVAR